MGSWLEPFLGLPLIWLVVAALLLVMRRQVLRWAERRAAARASPMREMDERAVAMLTWLYLPATLLAGGYFTVQVVPLLPRWHADAEKALSAIAAIFAVWVAWRGFSLLLYYWAETNPNAKTLVPPVQLFARVLFAVLGMAVVLSGVGYSLTKLWTALGIGSVAIALALQDTLTNSFAGLYIMLEQPFRVGDMIRLDSGEEGRVTRIGWRSTWLRTVPNNMVVVPNAKLARASITNYSLPQSTTAAITTVPVSYAAEPRHVRQVLDNVARKAVTEIEGLLPDPPPAARLTGFGDNAMNFSLICQVRDFTDQQAVQDELRCRIHEAFREAGIQMEAAPRAFLLEESAHGETPPVRPGGDSQP